MVGCLNDVADMCYFADNEAYIEITDEYVVDTLSDDHDAEELNGLHHRVYSYSDGLKRNHETDSKYMKRQREHLKRIWDLISQVSWMYWHISVIPSQMQLLKRLVIMYSEHQ